TGTDTQTGRPTSIEGLNGTESNSFTAPDGTVRTVTVSMGATDVIDPGPGHNFKSVLEQLCGPGVEYPSGGAYPEIPNSGYVSSYANVLKDAGKGTELAGDVMKCFDTRQQLPVLNALAREFVVCDHWFSSMPGPTEPNRYFSHAATCGTF